MNTRPSGPYKYITVTPDLKSAGSDALVVYPLLIVLTVSLHYPFSAYGHRAAAEFQENSAVNLICVYCDHYKERKIVIYIGFDDEVLP